jgi:molybdopterin-guanine dinucleotide biosynthesis protein A
MIALREITGLILAGGRAQRMGGIDKGLIPFHGRPLIESAIEALKRQTGQLLINANRNLAQYSTYGYPVVSDVTLDFSGPLAGFSAGLATCKTRYLLTAPCDSPLLPPDLSERLVGELEASGAQLVYASTEELDGKIWSQPVFCLMRSDVADSLNQFLTKGDLKIDHWFKDLHTSTVIFKNSQAFANINTPEELKHLESIV